ncbi:MAG: YibE/F family protein [Patescibacteria group bacterium]
MKKIFLISFFLIFNLFWTINCQAEENNNQNQEIKKINATVIFVGENSVRIKDNQGNHYEVDQSFETGSSEKVEKGMNVKAELITMQDGSIRCVISDINRLEKIWIFIIIFVFSVFCFLRKQGLIALLNLAITFLFVIFFIIPLVIKGYNPLISTIIGTSLAMTVMFFTLYGKTKKTLAISFSALISLIISTIFSWLFIKFTYLTGFASDEATYLVTAGYGHIDMKGLLLAAFLIGIMGTLDDIIINQVSIIESLKKINPKMKSWEAYREAMKIGRDHMSSMINTLIFAYAGAAFPLLILFYLKNPPFDSVNSILNNEIVATEIVRMIVGSMSLLFATPISSYLAVKFFLTKNKQR